MQDFRYRGIAKDGKITAGILQAVSEKSAYGELNSANITPIAIWPNDTVAADVKWWRRDIQFLSRGIPPQDISVTAKVISILLNAGLPLKDALSTASDSVPKSMKPVLASASEAISRGDKITAAFTRYKDRLPDTLLMLIEVGETANALSDSFSRAAIHFDRQAENSRKLRAAMIYPILLVLFSIFLMGVLVFFLVPALEPLFSPSGLGLPAMLSTLVAAKNIFANNGWVFLAGIIAIPVVIGSMRASEQGSRMLQKIGLAIPYLGKRKVLADLAQFSHALSIMLEAGLPFQNAIAAAAKTFQLYALKDLASSALGAMHQGESFVESFSQSNLMGQDFKQLIRLADQSNQWQLIMFEAAAALESQIEQTDRKLTTFVTPFLTIFIGSTIGILVISVISAILEINELAFQ